jgi:hypothetical protein
MTKRHSRGGMKPSPKNKRNKAARLRDREHAANVVVSLGGIGIDDLVFSERALLASDAHRARASAWKRQHQERRHGGRLRSSAEIIGGTALETLGLGTRDGVDRKTPLAHQMVVEIHDDITVKQVAEPVHRADEDGEPAEVKSEEPAPRPRQGRRFNPLALALCVALIGGGE